MSSIIPMPEIRREVVSNLGFWPATGQIALEEGRVAVAGLGGAGSMVVEVAGRLGVPEWSLADPDESDVSNRGRQAGASKHTIGMSKVDIARGLVEGIHQGAAVRAFHDGLWEHNSEDFIAGADVVLEAIDYSYAYLSAHLGRVARRSGIPMITSIEVGDGCQYTVFRANPTEYDQTSDAYFGVEETEDIIPDTAIDVDRMLSYWPYYASPRVLDLALSGDIPTPANATGVARNASAISRAIRIVLQNDNQRAIDAMSYPNVIIDDPDPSIGVMTVHHAQRAETLERTIAEAAEHELRVSKEGRYLFSSPGEYIVIEE